MGSTQLAPPPRVSPKGWAGFFWAAFKRSQNAMAVVDDGRHHVEVNGAYLNLLGHRRAALLGHPFWEVVEGGPILSELQWRAALRRGDALGTVSMVRADGGRVVVDYAAHPEVASGRQLVLFVVLHVDRRRHSTRPRRRPRREELTAREREVIGLVALGASGPEIADDLNISYATVRTHVRNAQVKLGAQSRAQLVAMTLGEMHLAQR